MVPSLRLARCSWQKTTVFRSEGTTMRRFAVLLFAVVTLAGCGGGSGGVAGTAGEQLAANMEDARGQAGLSLLFGLWDHISPDSELQRAVDLCYYQTACPELLGNAVIELCDGVLPGATDDEVRAATQTVVSDHFDALDRSDRSEIADALRDLADDIADGDVLWCD